MGDWVIFSIKSAIILSGLFGCYKIMLGRVDASGLRRGVLLAILVLSLVLPFCHVGYNRAQIDTIPLYIPEMPVINEPVATSYDARQFVYTALGIVIVLGTGILIVNTIITILTLTYYRVKGERKIVNGKRVTLIKGGIDTPFCFMGRIYLGSGDLEGPYNMIIAHEESHIRHMHFVDLLIGRIVTILQWWNPFVWVMMREMQMVHEFQADSDVLAAGFSRRDYQYFLLGRSIGKGMLLNVSGLGHGSLKKRLIMLNRNSSAKRGKYVAVFLVPMAVGLVSLFSLPGMSAVFSPFETLSVEGMLECVNAGKDASNTNTNLASVENDAEVVREGNSLPSESAKTVVVKDIEYNREKVAKVPGNEIKRKGAEVIENKNGEEENVAPNSATDFDMDLNASKSEVPVISFNDIKKDSQPAVFIDGKSEPYEKILDIDPNTVESIEVRKNDPENYPNGYIDVRLKDDGRKGHPAVFVNGKRVMYERLKSIDQKKIKSITVRKDNITEYPFGRIDVEIN